jgi:hypothetical protein
MSQEMIHNRRQFVVKAFWKTCDSQKIPQFEEYESISNMRPAINGELAL